MNKLNGKIVGISASANMANIQVDVAGDIFSTIILEGSQGPSSYKVHDHVTLLFKETEVGIAKHLSGMISIRNRFKSVIKAIDKGMILTKVSVEHKGHTIDAIITTQSADQLELNINDEIEWLVKSNEVILMKDTLREC